MKMCLFSHMEQEEGLQVQSIELALQSWKKMFQYARKKKTR